MLLLGKGKKAEFGCGFSVSLLQTSAMGEEVGR